MPDATETRRKLDLSWLKDLTTDQLEEKLRVYKFKDEIGHPLHNCCEFIELLNRSRERESMKLRGIKEALESLDK